MRGQGGEEKHKGGSGSGAERGRGSKEGGGEEKRLSSTHGIALESDELKHHRVCKFVRRSEIYEAGRLYFKIKSTLHIRVLICMRMYISMEYLVKVPYFAFTPPANNLSIILVYPIP